VVSRGGSRFDTDEAPELSGDLCDELRTPVGYVLLRRTVELPEVPVVQLGGANGIDLGVALHEVGTLTEDIDRDHDRVVPVGLWELDDEVD
jgi:hypothetical protein